MMIWRSDGTIQWTVIEIGTTVCTLLFLSTITGTFLSTGIGFSISAVTQIVVKAPFVEEVLFRGILLRGIHWIQTCYNGTSLDQLSSEERDNILAFQKAMRVHLVALIFLVMHTRRKLDLFQFACSSMGAISYGYLAEKYQLLAPSILAHGINNFIVALSITHPTIDHSYIAAGLVANRLASLALAWG